MINKIDNSIPKINEETGQPTNLTRIPKKVLDREDFIKLFITQLQYQDPMNPIENNEMAIQLALFNQVDQLMNINDTIKELKDLIENFQLNYAVSLIGKLVKIEGNIGRVENDKFLGGEFTLEEPYNKVEIIITDSQGKLIKKLELYNLEKGTHKILWDATDINGNIVPDGNYFISITAFKGEQPETIIPIVISKITGAILGESTKLVLNGKNQIDIDQIKEILGG